MITTTDQLAQKCGDCMQNCY